MFSWLDRWIRRYVFGQAPGTLTELSSAQADLATSLRDYFAGILNALINLAGSARDQRSASNKLTQEIANKLMWLYEAAWLFNRQQFLARFAQDEAVGNARYRQLLAGLAAAASQLHADMVALIKWILLTVVAPILLSLKVLGEQMIKWAFAAFDLLTHPPRLAGILFWPLFGVFALDPWTIGRQIGDWLVKLVYQNMLKSATLFEQILADVL